MRRMRQHAVSVFRTLPAESSVFAWDGVSVFAEWRPYTNPKTGKGGWISSGGMVRYGDPRKQEEDVAEKRRTAEQAVSNAIADPSKVTADHLPRLHEHLKTLPRDKLKEMAKSLRLKVGGVKAAVADRLIAHVTGDTAPRQGAALEGGRTPARRDDQPDRAHRGQDEPPPVKIDHVGDPNHPVAKSIAADPHARKVLGDLQPLIDRHRPAVDEYHAAEAELTATRKEGMRLAARHDEIMTEYADVAISGNRPKKGRAVQKKWDERRAEFYKVLDRQNEEVGKYKDREGESAVRVIAARSDMSGINGEFRSKLLESAKPDKPVTLTGVYEPPPGSTWNGFGAEPLTSAVTKEEFANAEMFVRGIVGHDREIHMVYGKSKTGRGFCSFGSKEDGGSAKPFSVNVSRDTEDVAFGRDHTRSVAIHEIGHAVEVTSPGLAEECYNFLQYRCSGERPVSLKEKFVGHNYDGWERGRKDQFDRGLDPAAGESAPYYVGKEYADATEVISMGLEHLWRNPAGLAVRDPEYFGFLMKVLRRSS